MDARVISAFTRVHSPSKTGVNALEDALLPAHDELVTASVDIALFGSLAGPIPVFSCFFADSESSIPGSHDLKHTHLLVPAAHVCARGLHRCFTDPESRGGRSAEKRSGAAAPVRPAHDAAGQAPSEAPCVL